MSNYINSWLENFERQAMIRRALIMSGNIIDLSFNRFNKLMPLNSIIEESLKALGFELVIFYSRLSGVSGINSQQWDELLKTQIQINAEQGEAYDMDLGDPQPILNNGRIQLQPNDFFATVEQVMTKSQRKIAFIVDWSNYLFGAANALTEMERAWLQQISTSLRDAQIIRNLDELTEAQSLIIFLCPGNVTLPPSSYLNNPLFAEINIPLPKPKEREAAILENQVRFHLNEPLTQGSQGLSDLVTLTDSLTLRDIYNLFRLSRQQELPLGLQNLVSLYRFGKRQSPWEELNHEKLRNAKKKLEERVKGQEQAINAVYNILIRAYIGLSGLQHSSKAYSPKGTLFFVGPTGVGKTELAKSLAAFLFGDEEACIRFDMSEFNHEHADQRLVGAPPGYVGFEEGGQLTNSVKSRPFSLLLFDEIEKAHPRILDKFLQILEDGRLTDGKGETISFSDTFIVFTSNIGAAHIQPDDNSENVIAQFKEAVQKHFKDVLNRPELLGRIGDANIIPFNFIQDLDILKAIARAKLKPLAERLKEKWGIEQIHFQNENKALETLVKQVNQSHGGRGVLNVLTKSLFDPLTEFLFEEVAQRQSLKGKTLEILQKGNFFFFELN